MVRKSSVITCILVVISACTQNNKKETVNKDSVVYTPVDSTRIPMVVDTFHNALGHLFAGTGLNRTLFNIDSLAFSRYADSMRNDYIRINTLRLHPLKTWIGKQFNNIQPASSKNVVYPFSGADLLHVLQVYPSSENYYLMALEPIGVLPQINGLSKEQTLKMVHELQYILRDVFLRSYFITKNMTQDFSTEKYINGVIPLMLWSCIVTGHNIHSVKSVYIDSTGKLFNESQPNNSNMNTGVKVSFFKNNTRQLKHAYYFRYDISNNGIKQNPGYFNYLKSIGDFYSFIKAASYLPHYDNFTQIDDFILSNSRFHFQDDTGIPFNKFQRDSFNMRLYGVYVKPIADFTSNLFQKSLFNAYQDSSKYFGHLPFSMGYQWSTSKQNQMIFYK